MITLTALETILITCLPAGTSIAAIIVTAFAILKSLSKLKENEQIKAERDALMDTNKKIIAETRTLKKQLSLLIEKAAKIDYKSLTEVQNDESLQV